LKYINYSLVLFAIVFLIYEFYRTRFSSKKPKFRTHAQLDLIAFLTATYILTSTIRLDIISLNQQKLPPFTENFYDSLVREQIDFLSDGIKKNEIVFDNSKESIFQLLKLLDNAQESYEAINTYTESWKKEINDLSQASIAAVEKGIKVSRCFILKNNYFEGELEEQFKEMKKEEEGGIEVFYIEENDIGKMPFFRDNNLRSMALVDSKILATDTSPRGASGGVTSITIIWKKSKVINNPFKQIMKYEKKFDSNIFLDIAEEYIQIN
ncbi:MAG: hypothetical protein AAGE84_21740, partial [Cyanobacteria bacterium P01_G01_bin.39]